MQIILPSIEGYAHTAAGAHIANAFKEATHEYRDDRTLAIYPHLFIGQDVPRDWILYNAEPIGGADGHGRNSKYIEFLRQYEVWDYSQHNVNELQAYGVNAKFCPIGYSPNMTKNWLQVEQDIDVLFYGSLNERRKTLLANLANKCEFRFVFGVYGEALDKLINRSKIVVNLHFYDAALFEIFRCSYLMANKKCIVSEIGKDEELESPYRDAVAFCPYGRLVENCLDLLQDDKFRHELEQRGFEIFSHRSQLDFVRCLI